MNAKMQPIFVIQMQRVTILTDPTLVRVIVGTLEMEQFAMVSSSKCRFLITHN